LLRNFTRRIRPSKNLNFGLTNNIGIAASGADENTIGSYALFIFSSGQTQQHSTLVVNFSKIISIGIGCGQTEFYFPTCKAIPGR